MASGLAGAWLGESSSQAVQRIQLAQNRVGLRAKIEQARYLVDADLDELLNLRGTGFRRAEQRAAVEEFLEEEIDGLIELLFGQARGVDIDTSTEGELGDESGIRLQVIAERPVGMAPD